MFHFWNCKNLAFHPPCLSIIPKQLGVGYDYWAVLFKSWFYIWHIVETYTKSTSSKRCYLATSSRLIHVYFTNQKSFLQKLKSGIVTSFFFKSTYLWRKIFISRYDMIIFIHKSWSVNSGWLTLFISSKITQGNSFDFKTFLTIFSLQGQSL